MAVREFNKSRGGRSVMAAVRGSKDPSLFVVVFEDSAAMLGLVVALAATYAYQVTGNILFDASASICIGLILAATAAWLAFEAKGLLIGESADPQTVAAIKTLVAAEEHVLSVNELITLHMGPSDIIVTLSVDFVDGIDSSVVEGTVTNLNRAIKALDPNIRRVFIEAERSGDHSATVEVIEQTGAVGDAE